MAYTIVSGQHATSAKVSNTNHMSGPMPRRIPGLFSAPKKGVFSGPRNRRGLRNMLKLFMVRGGVRDVLFVGSGSGVKRLT